MEYHNRGFLNKKQGMAAYESHVEVYGDDGEKSVYANIEFSDCSRKVCLEFEAYKQEVALEKLDKVDLLLAVVQEFRDKLHEAVQLAYKDNK